jgi:SAM-dependent methyltransferase
MNREYVQQYAALERKHWWFVVRQKVILQFLKKYINDQPISVLNIGAAAGASSQWLSSLGNVVSVETEPLFIQHLNVINSSVTDMPFADNSFDLVCAFDVIEHVDDDVVAMKEMERVCKAGGMICVTVPALKMLWSDHDIANEHFRRYTKKSLSSLGKIFSGLKKEEIQYFNSLLFLPILAARKISNSFSKNKSRLQSDFTRYKTPGLFNKLLQIIFSLELPLLRSIHFPVGVSLIAAWKKTSINK